MVPHLISCWFILFQLLPWQPVSYRYNLAVACFSYNTYLSPSALRLHRLCQELHLWHSSATVMRAQTWKDESVAHRTNGRWVMVGKCSLLYPAKGQCWGHSAQFLRGSHQDGALAGHSDQLNNVCLQWLSLLPCFALPSSPHFSQNTACMNPWSQPCFPGSKNN